MMKQLVLVGALVGVVGAGAVWAQGGEHTAPNPQPTTAPDPAIPTGELQLGTVRLPKAVRADGKPLAAGTYLVRVTSQTAAPAAPGETPAAERWAEFVQKGQIKGREVMTI